MSKRDDSVRVQVIHADGGVSWKELEWPDGMGLPEFLTRHGFEGEMSFCLGTNTLGEFQVSVHVPCVTEPGRNHYLVMVEMLEALEFVECEGFDALLQFLNRIAPVAAEARANAEQRAEGWHASNHRGEAVGNCRFCARRKKWDRW